MADDEILEEGAEGDAAGAGKKKKGGGLSGFLPTLLKWGAIGVGAVVLIVTVVVITMKVVGGNSAGQSVIPISQDYQAKREVLDWYGAIGVIRTKSSDPIPASISVEPVLGYKQADKTTQTELTSRQIEIKAFLRRYFAEKTAADLRPQNEDRIKIEIRNAINDDILTSSKIRDIQFMSFDIIEQ
jgi:flagellar FliL protein